MGDEQRREETKAGRLSNAMRAALWNMAEGRSAAHGLRGRAEHGGLAGTMNALHRRGLVKCLRGWELTDAGRTLADSWRCANCGHVEYHCPASGCNHVRVLPRSDDPDEEEWCDCEEFVPKEAAHG